LLADVILCIPTLYRLQHTICTRALAECSSLSLPTQDTLRALHQLGLSLPTYAIYATLVALALPLGYCSVGALIFWRKSNEWLGLFVSFTLILFGALQFTNLIGGFGGPYWPPPGAPAMANVFLALMALVQYPCLAVFLLTFPTGRFAPRWSWVIVLLWVGQLISYSLPSPYFVADWPTVLVAGELLLVWGSTLAVQIYRYRRVYTPVQRQQTKWVVFGISVGVVIIVTTEVIGGVVAPDSPYQLLNEFFELVLFLSLPLSIGIAILRYRLWDIDTIINQALVYGSLTALLGAVYAGLIIGLESVAGLFTRQASQPVVLVVSTLVIAALFLPVRRRLQATIDQRFYRRKFDAEKTLAAFSAVLQSEVDMHALAEHLLMVVHETMQPERVSLWLRPSEQPSREDSHYPESHASAFDE
jgi:hypothetical protein